MFCRARNNSHRVVFTYLRNGIERERRIEDGGSYRKLRWEVKFMKINRGSKWEGFTLVEIMIVVAIIGLLAAIAIPNFVRARQTAQRNACISNLREIDGAKEQWALENKKSNGDPIVKDEVDRYIKGGPPNCPAGGKYTYGNVGTDPTCTVAGHVLPNAGAAAGAGPAPAP